MNTSREIDLREHGLIHLGRIHARLAPASLVEQALRRNEGLMTWRGAVVAYTGERTGRSPQDRFLIPETDHADAIWWGSVNRKIDPGIFDKLLNQARAYLQGREVFVTDSWACADPRHRLSVRIIAEQAWHALFAQCLLLRPPLEFFETGRFKPELTLIAVPGLQADPARDGTRSEVFVILNLAQRIVLIGGTHYAGEIKKAVFSVLNYLLPQRGVFPMHCSANIGPGGDTALFFGLSGTGKTTLSADPERRLIGDDEHGWSDEGVFNIEGGCYAKTIRLSPEGEPQIYNAIRFGCILENVVVDPYTRQPDFDDDHFTENTRAAYPVDYIPRCELSGRGGHPANVVFLTCDAFGVLPPVSRLTADQALYHFLSGYTAKVAGTETGVTEPQVAFSTCFAAPFLPLHATRYAELLRQKIETHRSRVWLINTGWTGGPYGRGSRIQLSVTRAMVRAALNGELEKAPCQSDPVFQVLVPQACPGVPDEILQPRNTWKNAAEYDAQARRLAQMFRTNFEPYAGMVPEAVREAGPRAV